MNDLTFFLGANTCCGFYSLYEEYLTAREPRSVWILKGGAGCGKSSFLRRIAEKAGAAGLTVHRILCSGDPGSLDGIHIPELGALLFDGTAPHVLEPPQVGSRGFYVDLSRFYRPGAPDTEQAEQAYKAHYRQAYAWLAAAGEVESAVRLPEEAEREILRRAKSLMTRELRRKSRERGRTQRIFTDAFTCQGIVSLGETRTALCPRQICLQGVCGAEGLFLAAAAETALERGWDVILSPDPIRPEKPAHLLIPEQGLCVGCGGGGRRIRLDRAVYAAAGREEAGRMREAEAMRRALLIKAERELGLARSSHDRLEEAVNPFVDFDAVLAEADALAEKLLRGAGGQPPLAISGGRW